MDIEGTFPRVKVSIRSDWSQQTENRIAKKKKNDFSLQGKNPKKAFQNIIIISWLLK
jgi:hypothetical protein